MEPDEATAADEAIERIIEEGPTLLRTAQLARHVRVFWENCKADDMKLSVRVMLTQRFLDVCTGNDDGWDDELPEEDYE